MSVSQRQAIISLLEKEGKDRCYLDNWRQISLLNVNSKIASKVISLRIINVLPHIIFFSPKTFILYLNTFKNTDYTY